jgi:hypothetical protein
MWSGHRRRVYYSDGRYLAPRAFCLRHLWPAIGDASFYQAEGGLYHIDALPKTSWEWECRKHL